MNFFKMSGSGNDFILVDNRGGALAEIKDIPAFVQAVCRRKVSVGADGVILVESSERADFRWRFFNADGSEVEMCGNGGRCVARFAFLQGIAGERMSFETVAGIIDAEVRGDVVKLRLTEPSALQADRAIPIQDEMLTVDSLNTGVPHVVAFVKDLDAFDVFRYGRALRYSEAYAPAGTNANFVTVTGPHSLSVRTYERGVEDETLACGTGSVASALAAAARGEVTSPVEVTVRSGEILKIHFDKIDGAFRNVYLEGRVRVVYEGRLWEEAWQDNGY
ncbi:diaminopimelate epimerase [Syntrophus gentianae]|uniref:Diaminopimelate epimerase n=1 Tax=Syntrophus gentianae TaxID=43775 RepID=A0A1H7Y3X5_9BACT|nr:diaminopimelate epimerase [Syntrophus gentianae]SEM40842.1 diaminopimelate epimerase [Syntrophus gentianae]